MKNLLKIIIGLIFVFPANLKAEPIDDLAKDLSSQIKSVQTMRMAVLSFPYIDGFDSTGSKIVQERLITTLSQNKKFSVLERALLHKVLEQAKLEMSGLFDETTTIKLGKMLGVEAVLTGTLIDINERETILFLLSCVGHNNGAGFRLTCLIFQFPIHFWRYGNKRKPTTIRCSTGRSK